MNVLLFCTCVLISQVESSDIALATCNLWNVMFNWETRIQRIADMIREHELDIVVFQEVRLNNDANDEQAQSLTSQLAEFRPLLPEHKWILASSAGTVSRVKNSYKSDWKFEGLGIISRRQVIFSKTVRLKQSGFKDTNKRIALHVRLKHGESENDHIDVIVIHFSYDPHQQCRNANDIIKIIEDGNLKNVIVLGDFNAYESVTPPVNVFLLKEKSACQSDVNSKIVGTFKDAWLDAGNAHADGLTFSNMPIPGLQSRPDRILVSKSIQVSEAGAVGDGLYYWSKYYIPILLSRAHAVIKTSFQAFSSHQGYSCLQDCGPHGSCRCGVCVSGGDENNCDIPLCSECSVKKFLLFLCFLLPTFVVCVIFLLALIRILVISARFSQRDIQEILGYRCCLFNRQLFETRVLPRKFRVSVANCLQLYHLPPLWVALGSAGLLLFLLSIFKVCFKDSINLVYSILPEEHFPSDHKIVYAKLNV